MFVRESMWVVRAVARKESSVEVNVNENVKIPQTALELLLKQFYLQYNL